MRSRALLFVLGVAAGALRCGSAPAPAPPAEEWTASVVEARYGMPPVGPMCSRAPETGTVVVDVRCADGASLPSFQAVLTGPLIGGTRSAVASDGVARVLCVPATFHAYSEFTLALTLVRSKNGSRELRNVARVRVDRQSETHLRVKVECPRLTTAYPR